MATVVSGGLTIEDLEAMPDDGRRYELIGGAIVMTPAPEPVHQRVSRRLQSLLDAACPDGYELFDAPIDYDLPNGQRVQPDLIVVPDSSVKPKRLSGEALLVVEIVSPGSAVNDKVTKRAIYAEAGVASYWIVEPATARVVALRLVDGEYQEYLDTIGAVSLDWPLTVAFDLSSLVTR